MLENVLRDLPECRSCAAASVTISHLLFNYLNYYRKTKYYSLNKIFTSWGFGVLVLLVVLVLLLVCIVVVVVGVVVGCCCWCCCCC